MEVLAHDNEDRKCKKSSKTPQRGSGIRRSSTISEISQDDLDNWIMVFANN